MSEEGYGTMAAYGLLGLVYTASGAGKLKGLVTGAGHAAMGAGKRYPGWFLPIAIVHEFATVGAMAAGEKGLALIGSAGFVGGVFYTSLNPWDGLVRQSLPFS